MIKISIAKARTFAACVLFGFVGPVAAQQAYPSKPVRFIVPYPPGGSADPMARMAAQKLTARWSQQVIVDNRPGGNAIIGTEVVAKALADGYTIGLVFGPPFPSAPSLIAHLPYDTIKDFAPIATLAKFQTVLTLHPSVPANTLQEFIALTKTRAGQLNYASSGIGSALHLAGELYNIMVGTTIQHVAYKGSGPLIADLIGGQVQISYQVPISVIAHIKSGKLKALAITGEARSAVLPQVPTFAEAGLPGFDMTGWLGIVAPAGTPRAIVDRISGEIAAILALPDTLEYLAKQGMEPYISTPGQTSALINADIARLAKIIKTANIRLEN